MTQTRVVPSTRASTVPGSQSLVAARSPRTAQTTSGEALISMVLVRCGIGCYLRTQCWSAKRLNSATWAPPGSAMVTDVPAGPSVGPLTTEAPSETASLVATSRSSTSTYGSQRPGSESSDCTTPAQGCSPSTIQPRY